jgi:hypothetical protein
MIESRIRWAAAVGGLLVPLLLAGCAKQGCVGGEEGCRVASPCTAVKWTCEAPGELVVKVLAEGDRFPGGMNALGAVGDIYLSNGQVEAVISAIGHQNGVDPNGGTLLDLAVMGQDHDGLNSTAHTVGLLPRDGVRYTRLELIDERPARVAVQATGTLDGYPDVRVHTLYELRPCDRGVRMRTEAVNGWNEPQTWALADVFYWQDREIVSFSAAEGLGFFHPALALSTANESFRAFPFLAGMSHVAPHASYAHVVCNERLAEGLHNDFISLAGLSRRVVTPREFQVLERILVVEDGNDVAAAVDTAQEVRRQLFGEELVTLSGRVERAGGRSLGTITEASVVLTEGRFDQPKDRRIPWSQVVPAEDGSWSAKVPRGRRYLLEVFSFGKVRVERDLGQLDADAHVGEQVLPATSRVTLTAHDELGLPLNAVVYVIPVDEAGRAAHRGNFTGHEWISNPAGCAPWLGPEWGGSPACNRVLVENGQAQLEIPMGHFHFYAFKGPYWTIDRKTARLTDADRTVALVLSRLPLQPPGTLSADLHVHSGVSFDSSMPQRDRVVSFGAMDLQVVVASEHDVAWDFQQTIQSLGLGDRMSSVPGVETTAQIPFLSVPGDPFPRVIGHYIYWPIEVDVGLPRNGGPFDDLIEPGVLFDRFEARRSAEVGLIQLPHPWGGPYFGRDTGWPRAVHLDLRQDLPPEDDRTNAGLYLRTPPGASHANDAHHAQEVMNGTQNDALLEYRTVWHYMLGQGRLKTGTANSDSHSLTDNMVGVPQTVVYTDTPAGTGFDINTFNRALREGRAFGTNGPVLEAEIRGGGGAATPYSLTPFAPPEQARLFIRVSAAPWVPVDEVRVVVNGQVVLTIGSADLATPGDPFGIGGLLRLERELPLAPLLEGVGGDAWLVVEAGAALPLARDFGGGLDGGPDGVPDTGDNNGDGVVDERDIAPGEDFGPLRRPPTPTDPEHPSFHFSRVVFDGYPFAFTNPFVLDRNGNGRFDAPGVGGGR